MQPNLAEMDEFNKARGGPSDVAKFGEDAFWQERYARGASSFEWFLPLADVLEQSPPFKALLQSRVAGKAKLLEIGCGTSELLENLWDMGFRSVTGLDNQATALEFCRKRQGERRIEYVEGNMVQMPFGAAAFDVVVDKGALDALVCRGGDDLAKCGAELWRVLKPAPTSVLIVISNAPLDEIPSGLKPWFQKEQMTLIKNSAVGQYMAKLYLFSRRKTALKSN